LQVTKINMKMIFFSCYFSTNQSCLWFKALNENYVGTYRFLYSLLNIYVPEPEEEYTFIKCYFYMTFKKNV
jgi:hypothetical protein